MVRWFKPVVFFACLGPLARLGWKAYAGRLGANPIEVITHSTGDWILIFLLVTLSITPLRKLTGQLWLIRYRRMFGLFAFFYAVLHFLTYIWLDKFFDLHEMWADVLKRRFITVGFTGFVLLIPLALTSTQGWIRRLGGRRWQALHRLIYLSAIAGVPGGGLGAAESGREGSLNVGAKCRDRRGIGSFSRRSSGTAPGQDSKTDD
jgi:methionine sulfoxide reductase heme-binding subunit